MNVDQKKDSNEKLILMADAPRGTVVSAKDMQYLNDDGEWALAHPELRHEPHQEIGAMKT